MIVPAKQTPPQPVALSLVMPVYNEEGILRDAVDELAQELDRIVGTGGWQLIIVDNGSADATPREVAAIVERWPQTMAIRLDRPNLGRALRTGLEASEAPWGGIVMADEWDVPMLAWGWANRDRYDFVVGSKMADPNLNRQHWYRRLLTWGLNALLQLFVWHVGTDTHGPKLFNLERVRSLIAETVMERGQFDTELTLRAVRSGLRVVEVPVCYTEKRPPRNWMITKIGRNVRDLFRLVAEINRMPFADPLHFTRVSRQEVLAAAEVEPATMRRTTA